jgi:hypothetical protein
VKTTQTKEVIQLTMPEKGILFSRLSRLSIAGKLLAGESSAKNSNSAYS